MWLLGMLCNIAGSLIVNLGTNLMKSAHHVANQDVRRAILVTASVQSSSSSSSSSFRPTSSLGSSGGHFVRSVLTESFWYLIDMFTNFLHVLVNLSSESQWRVGAFFFALGSVINFSSFSMASQTLLSALGGVQFISNVFFARFLLREPLTLRMILATALIVLGLLAAVTFSSHSDKTHSVRELQQLYDSAYVRFLIVLAVCLVLAEGTYRWYTERERLMRPLPGSAWIRPALYCAVSAAVGTQGVLQCKCVAELLKASMHQSGQPSSQPLQYPSLGLDSSEYSGSSLTAITTTAGNSNLTTGQWAAGVGVGVSGGGSRGSEVMGYVYVYSILVALIMCLSFWVYRLNAALKVFSGSFVIPMLQACWTLGAILQGGFFFKEFQSFTSSQLVGFSVGVSLIMIGVFALTPTSTPSSTSTTSTITSTSSSTTSGIGGSSTKGIAMVGGVSSIGESVGGVASDIESRAASGGGGGGGGGGACPGSGDNDVFSPLGRRLMVISAEPLSVGEGSGGRSSAGKGNGWSSGQYAPLPQQLIEEGIDMKTLDNENCDVE